MAADLSGMLERHSDPIRPAMVAIGQSTMLGLPSCTEDRQSWLCKSSIDDPSWPKDRRTALERPVGDRGDTFQKP